MAVSNLMLAPSAASWLKRILGVLGLGAFALAVIVPVLAIFQSSLTGKPFGAGGFSGPYSLEPWRAAYSSSATYSAWWDTFKVAGAAAIASGTLGTGLAWTVSKSAVPYANFFRIALIVPLFMPTILTALGLVVTMAMMEQTLGWAPMDPYSYAGLVLSLTIIVAPFVYLIMLPVFDSLPSSLEEAGELFGQSKWRAFFRIAVPITAQASIGATILASVRLVTILDIPLLLGYPAGIEVFPARIYSQLYSNVSPNYGEATALASSVTALAFVAVYLYRRYTNERDFTTVTGKGFSVRPADVGRSRWVLSSGVWVFFLLAVIMPLAATAFGSFQGYFGAADSGFSTAAWSKVLTGPSLGRLLSNTALVAGACATVVVVVATIIARAERSRGRDLVGRGLGLVAWLPWMIPGMVLGIGLLWVTAQVIGLSGWKSFLVMILTFSIIYIPLGARQISAGLDQVGAELEEASLVAGFSRAGTFMRIVLPLLIPSLLAAFLLSFALVARDTSTALFVYTPQSETLGIRAVNSWREGSPSVAATYGVIIAMMNGLALLGYEIIRRRRRL